jgi:glycosyltransferase involved in cell wall biosynthesis
MYPNNDNRNLVSVIIPTYNRSAMVVEAIESVRRQTWRETQIIVVDDGSTDDTVARIQQMPDVLLVQQKSQRQAAARNNGLRHAKGAYICSLDSDDIWQPNFLERSLEALRTLNADFVFANWVSVDIYGNRYDSYFQKHYRWCDYPLAELPGWRILCPQASRALYLEVCASPSSSMLFRREQVQAGWVETMKVGDDWCLILDQVVKRECRVAFTMQPLWIKRVAYDNIYDRRDYGEVRRDLYVHDVKLMRDRLHSYLSRNEYACLSAYVGFHQLGMTKLDLKAKRFKSALRSGLEGLQNLSLGLVRSPHGVYARIRSISPRLQDKFEVTPEILQAEGLRSVEG